MSHNLEYSSALTGASFLFYEIKQVVKLSLEGLSDKEIKEVVIEDNLFEYQHVSSLKRAIPSLLRRKMAFDDVLVNMLLNENVETAKMINLYAIMKTDRLFFEWMAEVISQKLFEGDFLLEKKDINVFFNHKAEQSEKVSSFKEQTVKKLQTVHQRILHESGILMDIKKGTLTVPIIDMDLKEHLEAINDADYIKAMGA
nr:DUF1819 family protein [Salibacterium aidingense]